MSGLMLPLSGKSVIADISVVGTPQGIAANPASSIYAGVVGQNGYSMTVIDGSNTVIGNVAIATGSFFDAAWR